MPAAAMILAQLAVSCRGRQAACGFARTAPMMATRYCVLMALGGAAAWLIAVGLFCTAGAADAFLQATVFQLWLWPVRQSPLTALRPTSAGRSAVMDRRGDGDRRVDSQRPCNRRADRHIGDAASRSIRPFAGRVVLLRLRTVRSRRPTRNTTCYGFRWRRSSRPIRWSACGSGDDAPAPRRTFSASWRCLSCSRRRWRPMRFIAAPTGLCLTCSTASLRSPSASFAAAFIAVVATAAGVCIVRSRRAGAVLCLAVLGSVTPACETSTPSAGRIAARSRPGTGRSTCRPRRNGLRRLHGLGRVPPARLLLLVAQSLLAQSHGGRIARAGLAGESQAVAAEADMHRRERQEAARACWRGSNENYRPIEPPLYLRK